MSSVEKNIKIAFIFFLNQVFKIQHVFMTHCNLNEVCWTGSN